MVRSMKNSNICSKQVRLAKASARAVGTGRRLPGQYACRPRRARGRCLCLKWICSCRILPRSTGCFASTSCGASASPGTPGWHRPIMAMGTRCTPPRTCRWRWPGSRSSSTQLASPTPATFSSSSSLAVLEGCCGKTAATAASARPTSRPQVLRLL
eukprot:COSAG02_NODE_3555_length_6569_cov_36.053941_2_plen_156_part_00